MTKSEKRKQATKNKIEYRRKLAQSRKERGIFGTPFAKSK